MKTLLSNEVGSTFLELMVAVSLGLILVGGATLSINILRSETEIKTAAEITTFLEQASLCAIRSQTSVEVTVHDNLITESSKHRSISLPDYYDYTVKFGGNQNSISFYPSGFASAGTIAIHGDKNFCIISQTISGARRTECSNVN